MLHCKVNIIGVVCKAAHKLTVGVAVKIAEGEIFKRVEKVAAQLVDSSLGKDCHSRALYIVAYNANEKNAQENEKTNSKTLELFSCAAASGQCVYHWTHHISSRKGAYGAEKKTDKDNDNGPLFLGHISKEAFYGFFCILGLLEFTFFEAFLFVKELLFIFFGHYSPTPSC